MARRWQIAKFSHTLIMTGVVSAFTVLETKAVVFNVIDVVVFHVINAVVFNVIDDVVLTVV